MASFGVSFFGEVSENPYINLAVESMWEVEKSHFNHDLSAGTAQPVWRRARRPWFPSRLRQKVFFTTQRPDRLWSLPSLIHNGYRGLFPRDYSGRGVKMTTHLHLVQRSRMVELYLHFFIRLRGIVLN
jgi:hypothetical protein